MLCPVILISKQIPGQQIPTQAMAVLILTGRGISDRLKPALQPLADDRERDWSPGFSPSVSHNENR